MKHDSQASLVYDEIRRQILIAQLQPGVRLKEDAWAKRMQVSRVAVREALTRLLGEGLVIAGLRGGYFVTEMSPDDIKQIREVREILELAAIRLGIQTIRKEHIDDLLKICDDFSMLVAKGYIAGACEADIQFHQKLVALSGNARLLKAYHFSHIPLFHQKIGKTKMYLDDYKLTDKEHRQLVEALKVKNLAAAEKILRAHFDRGANAVLGDAS
jgi:DNA-binding GntR family transcriptional regulator